MAFSCYSCGQKRGDKKLAGILCEKKICTLCGPFTDENTIARLILFDNREIKATQVSDRHYVHS